jgi:enterochelin esterase family protein
MVLVVGIAALAQTPPYAELGAHASPRIANLRKQVEQGDSGAVDHFWQEVHKAGAPIVESAPTDPRYSLVTFLWEGDPSTRNVVIFDGVAGFDAKDRMTAIDSTNVWYKTYGVRNDARFAYNLSPNDNLEPFDSIKDNDAMERRLAAFRLDPLNPRRCPATFGALSAEASYVELPNATPRPWKATTASTPKGKVEAATLQSTILKNGHKLWLYTPYGYSTAAAPYPLLVLFDGDRNVKWIPAILDSLIADRKIPPLVAALVVNPSAATRNIELPCYPPFADFLATELIPWMREHYHATADPARTVAAGSSYGGLAAVFAGLRYPGTFGNVLSLSGSFFWKPEAEAEQEWLAKQVTAAPKLPVRFYLEVGVMEGYPLQIDGNRHMRDTLRAKGNSVGYAEYNGGHSFLNWSVGTATGLLFLLGDGGGVGRSH